MSKPKVIVHCTGCDETWESKWEASGNRCYLTGEGEVRLATDVERAAYCDVTFGDEVRASLARQDERYSR